MPRTAAKLKAMGVLPGSADLEFLGNVTGNARQALANCVLCSSN